MVAAGITHPASMDEIGSPRRPRMQRFSATPKPPRSVMRVAASSFLTRRKVERRHQAPHIRYLREFSRRLRVSGAAAARRRAAQLSGGLPLSSIDANTAYASVFAPYVRKVFSSLTQA
jgi:hypothetical protein